MEYIQEAFDEVVEKYDGGNISLYLAGFVLIGINVMIDEELLDPFSLHDELEKLSDDVQLFALKLKEIAEIEEKCNE